MSLSPTSSQPLELQLGDFLERDPDNVSIEDLHAICLAWEPTTDNVRALADACRQEEWRVPLRQAGFLARCLICMIQELSLRYDQALEHQLLRLVANCVAEVDENRQMVIPAMPKLWAIAERADANCYPALSAILNLCMDCEPGLEKAVEIDIHTRILIVLNGENVESAAINTCLDLIVAILPSVTASNQNLSLQLLDKVIAETTSLPKELSQGDYTWRLENMVMLLKNENVLTTLASDASGVSAAMSVLEDCVQRLEFLSGTAESSDNGEEVEWDEFLSETVHALAQIVVPWEVVSPATASSNDEYQTAFAGNPTVSVINRWFIEYSDDVLQNDSPSARFKVWCAFAAALMLGNMAKTATEATAIARLDKVIQTAVKITLAPLSGIEQEQELKNAATGLLRNLAPPKSNKALLMQNNVLGTVATQLAKFSNTEEDLEPCAMTLKLLRGVVTGNNANAVAFLRTKAEAGPYRAFELIAERIPAQARDFYRAVPRENWGSVPHPRIVTEIGRIVTEIHRAPLVDRDSGNDVAPPPIDALTALDTSCRAAEAVLFLVTHPDPACVSSGWLGLAAMSGRELGAGTVWCALSGHSGRLPCAYGEGSGSATFDAVLERLRAFGDEMPPSREGADRRNAMLFVHQLISYTRDDMQATQSAALQAVLRSHVDMLAPNAEPLTGPAE